MRARRTAAELGALARDAALRAIALVSDLEGDDADAAEVGLRARHVLCERSQQVCLPPNAQQTMPDDVHEATDIVDEGLTLVRRWEQKGVARFRPLA